jgi:hypothetical protein
MRLRRTMHRLLDPILSAPSRLRAMNTLKRLRAPDGTFYAVRDVPYVPQFASPDLIDAYIYRGLQGRDDPNWQHYGAPDPDTYTFWAHRACAIACLKMAIDAFETALPESMWSLIEQGRALGGYIVHDQDGQFIDMGWYHEPLVRLASAHGLEVAGRAYASVADICTRIHAGWLVAPAVSPSIGETGRIKQYDGHFVVAYGVKWRAGWPESLVIHNPSGRVATLRAGAEIPIQRFASAFAHRYMAFRPRGR